MTNYPFNALQKSYTHIKELVFDDVYDDIYLLFRKKKKRDSCIHTMEKTYLSREKYRICCARGSLSIR